MFSSNAPSNAGMFVKGFFALALLVVLCFASSGMAASTREIIYPPNKALFTGEEIEIRGFRPQSKGQATLTIRYGKNFITKYVIEPGEFSVTATLGRGFNFIQHEGEIVTVLFDDSGKKYKKLYFPDQHAVDNGCEDCHEIGEEAMSLLEEIPTLCYNCHDDLTLNAEGEKFSSIHPPLDDDDCMSCHAFHGASMSLRTSEQKNAICFDCHDDFTKIEEGGKEGEGEKEEGELIVHDPVESGACTDCHNPHASAHAGMLNADPVVLCAECHDNPSMNEEGEEWDVPHPAVDDGCATCHQLHVSKNPTLLKASVQEICLECHDSPGLNDHGYEWENTHRPVERGTCLDCHSPHGSPNGGLLAQPMVDLCQDCHDEMHSGHLRADGPENFPIPDDFLYEGDNSLIVCTACHHPHGSMDLFLFPADKSELCSHCHPYKR